MVERKLVCCFTVIVQYTWIANNGVTNTQTTHQYPLTVLITYYIYVRSEKIEMLNLESTFTKALF